MNEQKLQELVKRAARQRKKGRFFGVIFLILAVIFSVIAFATSNYTVLAGVLLHLVAGITLLIVNKERLEVPKEGKDYIILPGIYDITGESKEEYVEGLSAIVELSIIEKDDKHIRIKMPEKDYVSYTIEEQQKLLSDYMALLNNDKISVINIRPVVQWEINSATM